MYNFKRQASGVEDGKYIYSIERKDTYSKPIIFMDLDLTDWIQQTKFLVHLAYVKSNTLLF